MSEYRPCYVDGKKALFHRWIEKEEIVLKFKSFLSFKDREEFIKDFKANKTLPNFCDTEKVKNTFAIVEYDDGSIEEVEPSKIKFADNNIKECACDDED